MKDLSYFAVFSEMFAYPTAGSGQNIERWKAIVDRYDQATSKHLLPYLEMIHDKSLEYRQEYFAETFYVQPVCCLDVGYVLFGDDFRRGMFMVNLQKEHKKFGNDRGEELPDHLPVLLRLLSLAADEKFAEELVVSLLLPALNEMIRGFRSEGNVYRNLLLLLAGIMEQDFPDSEFEKFCLPKEKAFQKGHAEKVLMR